MEPRERADSEGIPEELSRDIIEHKAAIAIQRVFRGWMWRYKASESKRHTKAALIIQRAWRKCCTRMLCQRLKEIMAMYVITRAVVRYKRKLEIQRKYKEMRQFDPILSYYPTKSVPPEPNKGKRGRRRGGAASTIGFRKTLESMTARREVYFSSTATSRPIATPMQVKSKPVKKIKAAAKTPKANAGPKRKRRILVELPPPWHRKDARRISATQQDEMIYAQRNDVQWAKGDLMSHLMRKINAELDLRDDLVDRNEKFVNRPVQKPFISLNMRGKVHNLGSSPKVLQYIRELGMYIMASATYSMFCEIKTFSDDNVIVKNAFLIPAPLYDIAVHSRSGYVIGLDNRWCLRLFNGQETVIKRQLSPENKIPVAKKFLSFDGFGLLWVNMIPQKGDCMCFDPLTLSMVIRVNLDAIGTMHKFMRTNVALSPLGAKTEPIGFAGSFAGMTDVVLFTPNFSRARHLRHPDMDGFPTFKQSNNKMFVWSTDKVVYVYDLKDSIDLVQLTGKFNVEAAPIDVCCTVEPDLIYASLDDGSVRVYLGGKSEFPLRLPESKMSRAELTFAEAMIGSMKYTQSRPSFSEMGMYKLSSTAFRIEALSVTQKLAVVTAACSDSSVHSFWVLNDSQSVRAADFDQYEYSDVQQSHQTMIKEFQSQNQEMIKKRKSFMEISQFLGEFDGCANKGSLCNMFQPKATKFVLSKHIKGISLQRLFPFIPKTSVGEYSAYETFHYLRRSGILPTKLSEFSEFIKRNTESSMHRTVVTDQAFNIVAPVRTSGLYGAMVVKSFTPQDVDRIVSKINPVDGLRERLSKFTISSISTKVTENEKPSTARTWLSLYEKTELNRRLSAMSLLEDAVKHELMRRVQVSVDEAFNRNQLDKMVPVPSIDIHQSFNSSDCKNISFSEQPNRNPLLDQNCHNSIYQTWATRVLYGRDRSIYTDLRALFLPGRIFANPTVQSHFEMVRRVAMASKRITSEVYAFMNTPDGSAQVVITDDSKALPLSHYIKIHSFLGANSRLLMASRSVLSRILAVLYQLHKNGIILRTLIPENILLNAQTGVVSIGSVFDCQQASGVQRANYLPLPPSFAVPSNPFLPPEYFHDPPRRHTSAFDVWQFGILLLYLLTGFMPPAYGTELMKYIDDEQRMKMKRVHMTDSNEFSDPPLYPRINFFYDWLKGCNVVLLKEGERNQWTGDRGECFLTTERPGIPSILELDHYKLLPYKNTKIKYDESRLFLEIITSCLQIDPEKRPTVEQLLRTYPFSQANQIGDILDQYMRQPDPAVFVREFFKPSLDTMTNDSFPFTLGIIAALIFHEEMAEEDAAYSFPLDSRAAEQVISALFEVKFMDQLVTFVLNRIESKITYDDVNPTLKFKDDTFNALLKLFERFIQAVEHGHGSLLGHVDEVVMSFLGLYTSNPYLRHNSQDLLDDGKMAFKMSTTGSAALFVFTHSQAKSLVQYALRGSTYIVNSLHRTVEHNDGYFNQFIAFGESVYTLANAMCHSIEKQRMNAIMLMENLWNYGQTTHIVRLFIDFRVPQMIIHCFMNSSARMNALEFINDTMAAIKLRSFEPTYLLLQSCVHRSTVFHWCALALRTQDDEVKQQTLNIIDRVVFGESASSIKALFVDDVIWTAVENAKDPVISKIIWDILCFSSPFVIQVVQSSPNLRRILKGCGFEYDPEFDFDMLSGEMDIVTVLETARKVASALFIRQSSLPDDLKAENPPLKQSTDFLIKIIEQALAEADYAACVLDSEVTQSTRFDLKGTTYLKAKNTARETEFCDLQTLIAQLCDVMLHLFRCLCFYWRKPNCEFPKYLFQFILEKIQSTIPYCESMPHPAFLIHHCIQRMAMHTLVDLPINSPVRDIMLSMQEIWPKVMLRDIMFVMQCVDKDIVEIQLISRYPEERRIRQKMFQTIVVDNRTTNLSPVLRFVVNNMLHNRTQFKSSSLAQNYRYPIRSEAISMIMFLLGARDKYETAAKRLVDELLISNFLEEEKKLTDSDDEQQFIDSSILLLRQITQCKTLFEERTLKSAQTQLEQLCMRFSREWMNLSVLDGMASPKDTKKKDNRPTTRTGSVSKAHSRPKPKLRAMTSLGGAIAPASGSILSASLNLQSPSTARVATTRTVKTRMATSRAQEQQRPGTAITVTRQPRASTTVQSARRATSRQNK